MIQFKDFSFQYAKRDAIYQNLNFELRSGKIYGLLGKNGMGKSTLLRNICGLLFPSKGSVTVNGESPQNRNPSFLSDIIFIPEEIEMPNISIEKYGKVYGAFYPNFSSKDFYDLLKDFDLQANSRTKSLSFGQQKKLSIAFALASHVSFLIMDEPTNGLDIPSKRTFRKLIAANLTESKTFIISTHQVRDLDNLIDHILILHDRQIVLNASLSEVGEKLTTQVFRKDQLSNRVIYEEEQLNGHLALVPNLHKDFSKIDLEFLFNATLTSPATISEIFHETAVLESI